MFNLELKNNTCVIIVEECTIPYACGLIKGKDLILSLSIKVYKNNKNKPGKLMSSYLKTWFNSCSPKLFKSFLINFLSDVEFRSCYKISSSNWMGEYIVSNNDMLLIDSFIENNKCFIHIPVKIKASQKMYYSKNSKYYDIAIKNEAINMLINNSELSCLKQIFLNKSDLVFAICETIKGKSLNDIIIELTKEKMLTL